MTRIILFAVLVMLLFLSKAKKAAVWVAERSLILVGAARVVVSHVGGCRFLTARRLLARGSTVLIGLLARSLAKHRAGRPTASRLLARAHLPIPRVARRTKMAQDAVRMLRPGGIALPRRGRPGNFFRSAQVAAPGGRCADVVSG